ncbi:hypothetical protein PoB_001489900 [Plakobranchus ocellatus]|uniref:Uncharacterized protein n=1 Tax=Plakobranchus ocellatus TaxID=259542 RepID=A0AAV3YZD8_9GAST|nr:hypothetical protein PoB_001489900 [Plakobranchus ocellatus]
MSSCMNHGTWFHLATPQKEFSSKHVMLHEPWNLVSPGYSLGKSSCPRMSCCMNHGTWFHLATASERVLVHACHVA